MIRTLFLFISLSLCPVLAWAQTEEIDTLDAITAQQKKAESQAGVLSKQQRKIQDDISGLQNDLVTATAKSRGYERAATEARTRLTALEKEEAELKDRIGEDRNALSNMLAALQRIERQPPPAILATPNNAIDAVRAALLLTHLSEQLQIKSDLLSEQLFTLQSLQSKIGDNRIKLTSHASEVQLRLKGIRDILANKANLNKKLDKDRKSYESKAKTLAAKAQNLRDLIAKFEEQAGDIVPRLKPDPRSIEPNPQIKPKRKRNAPAPLYVPRGVGRFADARGNLPLPVLGTVSRQYGAPLSSGGRAKGISLKTAARAQVIAPFPARVEFSGAFNAEHVVILNVGNGYFIVLTGLADTFSSAGDYVKAGEPLGLMPRKSAEIFMEFRKNRASINPMPWIRHTLKK